MTQFQTIKFRVKLGLCIAILSILALAGYQAYSTWQENQNIVRLNIAHDVQITSLLLNDALADGSKFLDIAKFDLEAKGLSFKQDGPLIEESLNKSVSKFKISSWFNVYGNLLFVNSSGIVLAQTDGPMTKAVDVSDRFYFKNLKENSAQHLVIGPEVVARTNGKKVFHLATPLVNDKGEFIGLLVIQVDGYKFKIDLDKALGDGHETMGLYLPNGKLIFGMSNNLSADVHELLPESTIREIHSNINPDRVWQLPSQTLFSYGKIIAHSEIAQFKVEVIGWFSTKSVWIQTLSWGIKYLALILLSSLFVGYFAFRLLDSISQIQTENDLAIHDALTHLPNRRYFDEIFPKIQGDCRRSLAPLSVLFIDVDKFKDFNDRYGHECGDKALRAVGKTILRIKKRPLDFFCRWGGEEFVILLPNASQEGAMHYAQEILDSINATEIQVDNHVVVHISVSIGIATDIDGTHNFSDELIKEADAAMYSAKQAGRNRYEVYKA